MDRSDIPALSRLRLTRRQLDQMLAHVEACLPNEGCGLLAGQAGIVHEVLPITNAAASPVRFRMDPREQLRALEAMDDKGLELLGIYHSHPAGPVGPSVTDVAEAAYSAVYVIWSRDGGSWQVNGFWIDHGRISDVKLDAADGG